MRVFWMLLAVSLCLLLAACPKDEPTPEGVDQAGMKKPDAYSEGEKPAEEPTDAARPAEGDGTAPPAEGEGDGHNHGEGGHDEGHGEGEKDPPAEGGGDGGGEEKPPAEGGGEEKPPAEGDGEGGK